MDIVYYNGQCAVVYVRLEPIHYIYIAYESEPSLYLHLSHSMLSTSINCKNVDTYQKMYKYIYTKDKRFDAAALRHVVFFTIVATIVAVTVATDRNIHCKGRSFFSSVL